MRRNNRRFHNYCGAILSSLALLSFGAAAQADLIGHWNFDDGTGTTAADNASSNDAVIGDAANVVWTNGMIGGAAYLTGSNTDNGDFQIASIPELSGATSLSISAWFRPASTQAGQTYKGLMMTRSATTDQGSGQNWGIAWEGINHCENRHGGGGGQDTPDGSASETEVWYHLVMTWDAAENKRYVYLNGVQYTGASDVANGTVSITSSGDWAIGSDPGDNSRVFHGEIDDVAMWDNALAPGEIVAIYIGGLNGTAAPDVDLDVPPTILVQPVNDSRIFGDVAAEVSFTVNAAGVAEYYWYYDNKDGNGFQEDRIQADPTYSDGGYDIIDVKDYYVVIESLDGNTHVTSDVVTVEEYLPPITEGAQSIEPGDSAQFTIPMPDNGQTFVYQWYKDDTNMIAGATSAQLAISGADYDDAGTYKVDVTWNGMTMTSESVTLGVATGMERGLVGYWNFDETNGTVAADTMLGNDAVWDNASGTSLTWGNDGVVGTSATLGGGSSDRRFTVPNTLNSDAISMSGWVYVNSAADNVGIFCNRTTETSQWAMNMGKSGDLRVFNFRYQGQSVNPTVGYTTGQWYHLALVWDKVTGERSAYIDGELFSTDTLGEALDYKGAGVLNFGDDNCCSGRELNGMIDEFAMWSRPLTATEVSALYEGGLAGVPVNQVTDPNGAAHIQSQPMDAERIYGDPATTNEFSLVAVGGDPLLYQWRADGVDIAGATTNVLAIAGLGQADYDCVVSNPDGPTPGITTSVVVQVVDVLPDIEPAAQTVPAGATTGFRIAMPAGAYTYQWNFEGAPIAGETTDTLVLADLAAGDDGSYTVEVDLPALDPMVSDPATLLVTDASSYAFKNGVDEYAGTEDNTILANGDGADEDQSQGKRETLIVGHTDGTGERERTGILRFKMDEYAGVFSAIDSMKLRLTLDAASQHTNNTQDVTVKVYRVSNENGDWVEGEQGTAVAGASCFAQKRYGEADWNGTPGMQTAGDDYFDEVLGEFVITPTTSGMLEVDIVASAFSLTEMVAEWTSGNNGGFMLRSDEETGNQIFFDSAQNGDVAFNPEMLMEVTLSSGAPVIGVQPADVDMILGAEDTVTFTVVASGTGFMDYQWYYGNGAAIAGATDSSLVFDPAMTADAGSYYVVVSNVNGSVQSDVAELTLILPELSPAEVTIVEGGMMSYSLTGLSDTAIYTYKWKKDGVDLGVTDEMLVISNATAATDGAYTVDVMLDSTTLTSSASDLEVLITSGATTATVGGNKTGSADDVQDTELISWAADGAFGGRWEFGCRINSGTAHSAIRFPELENLDPAAIGEIKGAVLRLKVRVYYSGEESVRSWDNIQVRQILDTDADWVEGPDNNTTVDGFATYNNAQHTNVVWSSGTFGAATCDEAVLGRVNWATVPAGVDQIVDIPLTGDLNFILDWITGDAPNAGFALLAGAKSASGESRVDFYSSEASAMTNATGELSYPNAAGPELILFYGAAAPEIVSIDTVDASTMELQWTSAAGDHEYAVEATDDLVNGTWTAVETGIMPTPPMNTQTVSFAAGMTFYRVVEMPPPAIFFDDFEDGVNGWTTAAGGTGSGTVWELGTPDAQGSAGFDLTAANSPDNAWGTGIASGSYSNKVTLTLTSPMIDLSAETGDVTLSFMQALQLETDSNSKDYVKVKLLVGGVTTDIVEFEKLTISDWTQYVSDPIDASSFGNVQFVFEFVSDLTNVEIDFAGWFVDDVQVD